MALPAPVTAGELQASLYAALAWGVVFLTLAGALLLVWALLERHFTEYAITVSSNLGGRIIKVQGILSRQTVTVPLGMVNNLVLYEPLLGRVLGWGHIDIETGNDYDGDRLEYVPDPRTFHQLWKTLLDNGYTGPVRGTLPRDAGPYVDARPYGRISTTDATTARRSSSAMRRKR